MMTYNDYRNEVLSDAKDVIDGCAKGCDDFKRLYNDLFAYDSVTGNGSGSYTFNAAEARENTSGIFNDYEALDALVSIGVTSDRLANYVYDGDYETLDVCLRCAALSESYGELEEYFNSLR